MTLFIYWFDLQFLLPWPQFVRTFSINAFTVGTGQISGLFIYPVSDWISEKAVYRIDVKKQN